MIFLGGLVQRLMGDTVTLRPFIVLCLIAVFISGVLIYRIGQHYWGTWVGGWVAAAFVFCFWPYQYVLFAKHQPVGLVIFLFSIFCVQQAGLSHHKKARGYFLSGCLLGISWFTSSVALTYLPFWIVAFILSVQFRKKKNLKPTNSFAAWGTAGGAVAVALIGVIVWLNYPQVLANLQHYQEYVKISASYNHFFYNQPFLQQWFPQAEVALVRGGWIWVGKYSLAVLPVLFPLACVASFGMLVTALRCGSPVLQLGQGIGIILLGLSPVILAEVKGVAQYGANYFPLLPGVLLILGHALSQFCSLPASLPWHEKFKNILKLGCWLILLTHGIMNFMVFTRDIFPTRMATTYVSQFLENHAETRIATYFKHPLNNYMINQLDAALLPQLVFVPIQTIAQAQEGVILVPPTSGDSIYQAMVSRYHDYDQDLLLNELIRANRLEEFALASFRTMAASRYWPLEEEILAYRQLMLGHFQKRDRPQDKVWLLDAQKIRHALPTMVIPSESINLQQNGIRNIGLETRQHMSLGQMKRLTQSAVLQGLEFSMAKVGNPQDQLVAYVYRLDEVQPVWVPVGENFYSRPVPAGELASFPLNRRISFQFDPPLNLAAGLYYVTIFRTGSWNDQHFYRIFPES